MNKITSILGFPSAYRLFIGMVGGAGTRKRYLAEYVKPKAGDKVLDLGCGPADILEHLPKVNYTGLDISAEYISAAKARFGSRGRFLCADVGVVTLEEERGSFDLVMANGVVHHLDDEQAAKLFKLANLAMKPAGRVVTRDGCYVVGQSPVTRWLLAHDRGKFVRTQTEYLDLASRYFSRVSCHVRHDLLRIPYTHLIMICSNGSG